MPFGVCSWLAPRKLTRTARRGRRVSTGAIATPYTACGCVDGSKSSKPGRTCILLQERVIVIVHVIQVVVCVLLVKMRVFSVHPRQVRRVVGRVSIVFPVPAGHVLVRFERVCLATTHPTRTESSEVVIKPASVDDGSDCTGTLVGGTDVVPGTVQTRYDVVRVMILTSRYDNMAKQTPAINYLILWVKCERYAANPQLFGHAQDPHPLHS